MVNKEGRRGGGGKRREKKFEACKKRINIVQNSNLYIGPLPFIFLKSEASPLFFFFLSERDCGYVCLITEN